jgi:hypothetical protein
MPHQRRTARRAPSIFDLRSPISDLEGMGGRRPGSLVRCRAPLGSL